jgi:hypothetical protein
MVRLFDDGATAGYIIYNDHYLYTSGSVLSIFDVSDPENPSRLCNYQPPHSGGSFYVTGDYVFITSWSNPPIDLFQGIMVIDASDKTNPVLVSSFPTEEGPKNIYIEGNYAFILENSLIEVADISNLESPVIVARQDSITNGSTMIVRDNKIYLGSVTFMIMQFNSPTLINEHDTKLPQISDLNCFPNPSNSSFSINFNQANAGNVKIEIYDIQGRQAETILNGYSLAGNHSVIWNSTNNASGIYFAKLESGKQVSYMKLILLK